MYMSVLPKCMCALCTTWVPGAQEGRGRVSDPLDSGELSCGGTGAWT